MAKGDAFSQPVIPACFHRTLKNSDMINIRTLSFSVTILDLVFVVPRLIWSYMFTHMMVCLSVGSVLCKCRLCLCVHPVI